MINRFESADVLIIGAGLSGIGAAYHVQRAFPNREYVILEAREAMGGTWDLFRFPGVRSDSDMFTLGYPFRSWRGERSIADGESILGYLRETAVEAGIDRRIRFGHRVVRADWSSSQQQWAVTAECTATGETVTLTAKFLFCCSGYFRYDRGYTPKLPGLEEFPGPVVHPQHWPQDLDVAGKQVVVIGSGATAITLGPALAEMGAQVSILQRSPSYVLSAPGRDRVATGLRRLIPHRAAHTVVRAKNIAVSTANYVVSRRYPDVMRTRIRRRQQRLLSPGYDLDTHFTPRYAPWDQRLCLTPDGELFRAIRSGAVTMVTDQIAAVSRTGVRLGSGAELPTDIIVTATGLDLLVFGGIRLSLDGEPVQVPEQRAYKAMMLSGVPNFAYIIGYVHTSWTLKAELVCRYVIRLLRYLDAHGYTSATPVADPSIGRAPYVPNFTPGYFRRGGARFPSQGDSKPWRLRLNYLLDLPAFRFSRIDDGTLRFVGRDHHPAISGPRRSSSAAMAPEVRPAISRMKSILSRP